MFPAAFSRWIADKTMNEVACPSQEADSTNDCKAIGLTAAILCNNTQMTVTGWEELFVELKTCGVFVQGATAADFQQTTSRAIYLERVAAIVWAMILKFEVCRCVDPRYDMVVREVIAQDTLRAWTTEV